MHRFWEIDELVRMLASDLKDRCDASASALALACCSKRLNDIVLDSLWEHLGDLYRLLSCLPPESWELTGDEEFVFLRCPSAEEWARFSGYARRIRTFFAWGSTGISLEAYHLLSMQTLTLGPYLLPNLHSISWCDSWDLLPFLRLFLNPGLVDVDIEFPDTEPHIYRHATISMIPTRNLTELRIHSVWGNNPPDVDTLHYLLCMNALYNLLEQASKTLRSAYLDGELSITVIKKLLQLPNLRLLKAGLPRTHIPLPAVVLPSLEELIVSYGETSSLLHILRNILNPTLRELRVFSRDPSPACLQTLGISLLEVNIEQTLSSLDCHGNGIPLTEAGLHPFLSFGRLTKLDLLFPCTGEGCSFQLNDSIISKLAVALPRLTHLGLGGTPCEAATSDVTIASLVVLSINCVDLDFLRLHFNANGIISHDVHTNSQTHKFTCKLRTLVVGSRPLPSNHDDILLLTFTILHIFPHLANVVCEGQGWSRVERTIQLFQKAPKTIPLPPTI